jgi:hypothetical protein
MSFLEAPLIGEMWIWQSPDATDSRGPYLVISNGVQVKKYWSVQAFNLDSCQKEEIFFFRQTPQKSSVEWDWKKM